MGGQAYLARVIQLFQPVDFLGSGMLRLGFGWAWVYFELGGLQVTGTLLDLVQEPGFDGLVFENNYLFFIAQTCMT